MNCDTPSFGMSLQDVTESLRGQCHDLHLTAIASWLHSMIEQRDSALAQNAELAATVEVLRKVTEKAMFKCRILSNIAYNVGQSHEESESILSCVHEADRSMTSVNDALSATAQQHLRDVRAEAISGALKILSHRWKSDTEGDAAFVRVSELIEYAERVRAGGK